MPNERFKPKVTQAGVLDKVVMALSGGRYGVDRIVDFTFGEDVNVIANIHDPAEVITARRRYQIVSRSRE